MCFKIVQLAFLLCEIPYCCAVRSNSVLRMRSYTTSFMCALIFTIKLRTQIPSSLWCLQFSSTLSMIVINLNILFAKYECMDHWGYSKKNGRPSYFSNFWYSLYYQIIFILKIMFIIFLVLERIYAGIIRNVLFRLIIA